MNYQVPVPTFAETQVSFCLDIISIVSEYLLLTNRELAKAAKKYPKGFAGEIQRSSVGIGEKRETEPSRVTLKSLLLRQNQDFEFGRYKIHYGDVYYQVEILIYVYPNINRTQFHLDLKLFEFKATTGMILKVQRRVDEPDVDYHKYVMRGRRLGKIVYLFR